jgi:hypothetical protein
MGNGWFISYQRPTAGNVPSSYAAPVCPVREYGLNPKLAAFS